MSILGGLLLKVKTKVQPRAPRHPRPLFIINDNAQSLAPPLPSVGELGAPIQTVRTIIDEELGETEQKRILASLTDDELLGYVKADKSPIPAPPNRENYGGDNHLLYWTMGLGDALLNDQLISKYLSASRAMMS